MSEVLDVQALLEPVSEDQPCGEDLEDSPLLASLDVYRVFVGDRGFPPDQPPDWSEIRERATEALAKSRDLRLLTHLGAAALRTDGLPAFLESVAVASRWLEGHWSDVYPRLEGEDAILRRNALNSFADPIGVVDGVRRAPLVSSRQHGRFSLRDCEIAAGDLPPGEDEAVPDGNAIDAAFSEMAIDELRTLSTGVDDATTALNAIETKMREEAGTEAAPTFDPLTTQLQRLHRLLSGHLEKHPDAQPEDAAGGEEAADGSAAVGAIRNRQDAIRALDAVSEFFRRHEPSSPVPLFLDRAKRLVAKDFLEVVADVAPGGLQEAKSVGGVDLEG